MLKKLEIRILLASVLIILALPIFVSADSQGQTKNFFVDPNHDNQGREQVSATLEKVSQQGYFYLEDAWYKNLTDSEKEKINQNLEKLAQEFDNVIYPELTSTFGDEWKPGIDSDYRVTILFHQMKEGVAGYFRSEDGYPKVQSPKSNEREMVYIAALSLSEHILAKSYLAHEFVHLITFNQKERLRGVQEEVWLNELRAEMAPTLLGYDDEYQGSNLQQRVRQFVDSPSNSLTEWRGQKADYGSVNLFGLYLLDHWGVEILVDSLQSAKTGIESINEALKKNNFEKDFSQIFTDWAIALFLNDCDVSSAYCYKNENLKRFKITPSLVFLPSTQKTEFSLDYSIKQWAGHWYRIFGGEGDLKLTFDGQDSVNFKAPYVLCKDTYQCQVEFLDLDQKQKGEIFLQDFGSAWRSLTLIPSIQSKISGFDGREPSYNFSLSIALQIKADEELIEELKAQIEELKAQIAEIQQKIADLLSKKGTGTFFTNLYYGLQSEEVRYLQEFLKAQGSDIYPEGLVTGFFGPLTRAAVSRFQEKYSDEILAPLGLGKGTGYAGPATRAKINQMLLK